MALNSLEDLLQEALADFEEAPCAHATSLPSNQKPVSARPAPAESVQASEDFQQAPEVIAPAAASKPAPKGLGLGLGGSDILGRRPRKPVGSGSAAAGPPANDETPAIADDGGGGGADGPPKPPHKLPAEAQRLADDLMSLLQEAGLGEGPGHEDPEALSACLADFMGATGGGPAAGGSFPAGRRGEAFPRSTAAAGALAPGTGPGAGLGEDDPFAQLFGRIMGGLMPPSGGTASGDEGPPPPSPEFAAMLQQMMGAGAPAAGPDVRPPVAAEEPAGTPGAGPSVAGAPAEDEDDALASSRLAGLAKQTLKTVSQQAKKTRGHVEGGPAGRPGGGGGGLPFGSGATGGGGGLAAILRELGGLGMPGGGSGEGGGEGAAPAGVGVMVDYIMQHLLSKDVLYGPLKEIRDRYPPWLEAHQGTLPAEDYRRYVAQYESVQRVCVHYETAPSDFAKLMDLIQEMQTYGDPPGDIVEEMTGGAGRDINSILAAAEREETGPGGPQPALEELSGELDKCKVQ